MKIFYRNAEQNPMVQREGKNLMYFEKKKKNIGPENK